MILPSRHSLADVANAMNLSIAVEIGTHQGVFANSFMHRFRGMLICVDPWDGYDGSLPNFYPAFDESTANREDDFKIAQASLFGFGHRVRLLRNTSAEAVSLIDVVEFVYVDGLHDYKSVSFDINRWFEKLLPGGIISGHDFHYDHPGVIKAVMELRDAHDLEVYLTGDSIPSWWAIKR